MSSLEPTFESQHHHRESFSTRIRPPGRWNSLDIKELWRYRELFAFLAWRDIKVRYKQTIIGAGWAILQPVMMMLVFSVFLGRLAGLDGGDTPYAVFVFAGLVPWTFFSTSISLASNSVVGSEKLITKVYFPRLIIPIASIGTALIDALLTSVLLLGMLLWSGVWPSLSWLAIPLVIFTIGACAVGVGTWLAALNVAYRDFRYIVPFLVQLWLFATPSVYLRLDQLAENNPISKLPYVLQLLCYLNPMTVLIDSFRCLLLAEPYNLSALMISAGVSLFLMISGCAYFRHVEHRFADIV